MNEEEMKNQIKYIIEVVTQGDDYTLRYYDIQYIMRLLDLYQQEKEKNKELSSKLVGKICRGVEEDILEEYRQQIKDLKRKIKEV